jgi:endonuclease/exonuclease/phosphatase (EEP) superfamily protein YafD
MLLLNLLHVVAGFAAIASLLGFAGKLWWKFELLDHPRPQYCLGLLLGLLVGWSLGQWWSLIWLVPLVVNIVLLAPLFLPLPKPDHRPTTPPLRLLHANIDRHNPQPDRVIHYLQQQSVDLLLLQEITPAWLARLQAELPEYQVLKAEAFAHTMGSAVLIPKQHSPFKIEQIQTIHLPENSDRPLLEIMINNGNQSIAILSFHVIRPRSTQTSNRQVTEFAAAADWSRTQLQQQSAVVLIGDFNSTFWSQRLRQLEPDSQLINSQRGFGFQPTWSAHFPPLMKIAIDHCFHSRNLIVIRRKIGTDIASDHLPLLVELGFLSGRNDHDLTEALRPDRLVC